MCPDEQILCAWVENNLSESGNKKIEAHLNACPQCFEKAFFLKKALLREPLFMQESGKETILKKLILFIENQNIKIKDFVGKIQIKPLEMAFRNQDVKKEAVQFQLADLTFRLEKDRDDILLSLEKEGEFEIQTREGRVVFSGKNSAGVPVYLKSAQVYLLKARKEEVTLEFKNV